MGDLSDTTPHFVCVELEDMAEFPMSVAHILRFDRFKSYFGPDDLYKKSHIRFQHITSDTMRLFCKREGGARIWQLGLDDHTLVRLYILGELYECDDLRDLVLDLIFDRRNRHYVSDVALVTEAWVCLKPTSALIKFLVDDAAHLLYPDGDQKKISAEEIGRYPPEFWSIVKAQADWRKGPERRTRGWFRRPEVYLRMAHAQENYATGNEGKMGDLLSRNEELQERIEELQERIEELKSEIKNSGTTETRQKCPKCMWSGFMVNADEQESVRPDTVDEQESGISDTVDEQDGGVPVASGSEPSGSVSAEQNIWKYVP